MILGLLSDTHNHLRAARQALALLRQGGAEHLVHCGDSGADVLDLLSAECQARHIRAHVALGNCDESFALSAAYAPQPAGLTIALAPQFQLDGCSMAVAHGDDFHLVEALLTAQTLDMLFVGHTHRPSCHTEGRTLVVNPGSPARPRNGIPTVALLDTASRTPQWIALDAANL